jgi:hypothetical protein
MQPQYQQECRGANAPGGDYRSRDRTLRFRHQALTLGTVPDPV